MAVIYPEGLFHGDRLKRCSDAARLYWPYFFLSANGFGRFELDYRSVIRDVLVDFKSTLSEDEFYGFIQEYREAHLLFLYEYRGKVWGQWHCKDKCLPYFKTRADKESPEPPPDAYEKWQKAYEIEPKALPKASKLLRNLPKCLENNSLGIGGGIGKGEGIGQAQDARFDFEKAFEELRAVYPKKGIANIPDCERLYHEKLMVAQDREAFHKSVMDRMRRFWVPSQKWADGFVKNFDEFIRQEKWREEPEPATASEAPMAKRMIL